MLVSVLILNYRNPQAAVSCVQQFLKQTIADQIEIIVIDNHSLDDSVGVLRNYFGENAQVRIVETPKNQGFGYGYNFGARYARGEFLVVNNPDKILPEDGVDKLIKKLQSDDSIGIVAPRLLHPDGSVRQSLRRFPRIIDILSRRSILGRLFPRVLRRYLMLDRDPEIEQNVDWVPGGSFAIARSLFTEIGGFDERFFLFFEDTDLCRRVHLAGKSVLYYPQVTGRDKRRRLSGDSFIDLLFKKTGRIHVLSAWKYFWKWGLKS